MQEPVSYLQGFIHARAGGLLDLYPAYYLRYLTSVASVSAFCYPSGSRKWLTRRARLVTLSAVRASTALPWLQAASSLPLLQRVVVARPLMLEKPFRPLGAQGMGFRDRARFVVDHYTLLEAALPACVCDRIYLAGGLKWWSADGRYMLRLADSGPNPREGELAFYWSDTQAGVCLAQLSFYLRRGDHGAEIFVGGLQGPMGEQSRELIREATKASEGLRPKDLVMEALLALAEAVGVRRVVAVSRANHVGRQRRTPREIQADYEGFWMEYHGTLLADGNIEVPVCQPQRDIAEIPSKKRSAWRRKQAMTDSVRGIVLGWLRADATVAGNDAQMPVEAAAAA
ncbi:VirK/YbjX family protein [Cupriavidus sp. BIS7]|uniref:VirK/YbjX family protein n=1 Tax=Cupriavidus sp. BIS7 TaxID=1217718 RepID=UPI0002FF9133|nr:VirK/YbjX family protein [Cupriavidus sp. BIS7]